jgi:hypothetical protein
MKKQVKFYGLIRKLGNSHVVTIPKTLTVSELVIPGKTYFFAVIDEEETTWAEK